MKSELMIECDESWIDSIYRYRLDVHTGIPSRRRLIVIQINPSKAGQKRVNGKIRSDSTIGKVSRWARESQFGKVTFLNLFAYIASEQKSLASLDYKVLVGPRNDRFIKSAIAGAGTIVVAWGKPDKTIDRDNFSRRISELQRILGRRAVHAVGNPVSLHFPRHGRLWNSGNRHLRRFNWPSSVAN